MAAKVAAAAAAAAGRSAATVAARFAATGRVGTDIRRFAFCSPRCCLAGDTTHTAAACAPPVLAQAPSFPHIIRRGLAMIPGGHRPGPCDFSPDCFDPEAPGDTTHTAAACASPVLAQAPSFPHIIRRGLAMIPGGHRPGPCDFSPDCYDPEDPESPDDPATCFAYDEKDLESEETMWALYERWCSFHDMKRDNDDMVRRFGFFKDRACRILEFNKSGKPYTLGLNTLGDATPEEVSDIMRCQLL